jgi:hypothetical protein
MSMEMRKSGAVDEGDRSGPISGTNTLTPIVEYDAPNAKPRSAFAHELGHAAIGLFDDYVTGEVSVTVDTTDVESDLWNYTNNDVLLDREGQRYFGMPFEVDGAPLMKNNRSVRLRYFWGRATWLNAQAAGGLNVFAYLSAKRFRIAYEPPGFAKLKFAKPNKAGFESIYKPTQWSKDWLWDPAVAPVAPVLGSPAKPGRPGKLAKCDLHLYHLGEDEFSKSKNGGPYNGILALCMKLSASFDIPAHAGLTDYKKDDIVRSGGTHYKCKADHKSGLFAELGSMSASKWRVVNDVKICRQKIAHLEDLNRRIMAMLQDKFKLKGNGGDFSMTYLRIFPQWEITNAVGNATAGTHLKIEFAFGSKKFKPVAADPAAGTPHYLIAGTGCNPKSIIRYLFGKIGDNPHEWPAQGGVDGDLNKDDMGKLAEWMNANAGAHFSVENI